ncbi:hypothetical protein S245_011521, partial [Arachis hypogaea]
GREGSTKLRQTLNTKYDHKITRVNVGQGKQPDHQLRPLNDRSMIMECVIAHSTLAPKKNGTKQSAETVGCKNKLVGEPSAFEKRTRAGICRQSRSKNLGLSNANISENPMPQKSKSSSAKFVHRG